MMGVVLWEFSLGQSMSSIKWRTDTPSNCEMVKRACVALWNTQNKKTKLHINHIIHNMINKKYETYKEQENVTPKQEKT